jgi:alcohol dehydrogenase class IV
MDFQFYSPTQLIVGCQKLQEIGEKARPLGTRAFLLFGGSMRDSGVVPKVQALLENAGIQAVLYQKPGGEPDVRMVDAAAEAARAERCDLVISLGGGAVIDLGKAVAGLVTNAGSVQEYMEGIGSGREVTERPIPHIAVPTTAGTGAEVTKNAVITAPQVQYKKSFRSPWLFPTLAILDAELTVPLPAEQTAYSGMDAITQLIESYISQRATPMTDALAIYGLELALPAIREVYIDGTNTGAREKMLLASTLSGICLANAGLGIAHGFAPAVGAMYDVPHGKACAILLPHAMRFNRDAALPKLANIGRLLFGDTGKPMEIMAEEAISAIRQLVDELNIPSDFTWLQVNPDDIGDLVERSKGNSLKGNPAAVSPDEARGFIEPLL